MPIKLLQNITGREGGKFSNFKAYQKKGEEEEKEGRGEEKKKRGSKSFCAYPGEAFQTDREDG